MEGTVTVLSEDIKLEALKEIEAIWPNSLNYLDFTISCAALGNTYGQIYLFVRVDHENKRVNMFYGSEILDKENKDFINEVNAHMKKNKIYKGNCKVKLLMGNYLI